MPPQPGEFRNIRVESLIGSNDSDHFDRSSHPVQEIAATNKNGPEVRITVEVLCETDCVLVEGASSWRSEERVLAGRARPGKRRVLFEPTLSFTKAGSEQSLRIRVLMRRLHSEENPRPIGEIEHRVWIS